MKLVLFIVVVMSTLLPETHGNIYPMPVTTKAPILCAPNVTTKVPTTCAPKVTTKVPTTTCAPKVTTQVPTTCAPKVTTQVPTTCAPKVTTQVPTTSAPKVTTQVPTTCAPNPTKAPTTPAPKTTTKAPPPVCGKNEVYSACGATGCVNTCAKPTFSQISKCACVPGCICIDGYLRNSKNVCVAPQQCDTCKENEEFSPCDAHGCRNTCAEPERLLSCTYAAGCYPGCICIEGYLKNADGVCVKKETCVNQCPNPNESYNSCGTACPKTCENKDKDIICTFQCVAGCFCNEGYVRSADGVCILPEKCPNKCPNPNESFNTCGTACPKTCENKDKIIPCTRQCVSGCFCNDGYVKDAKGVCILPESCPKTCPENEAYNECGTACTKTCKTKDVMFKCIAKCVAGCFCQEGYIRDDINGKCIPLRDCPLVCGPNQVINECPPCPKGLICAAVCTPRCECIPGYIFDNTGTCIVKEPNKCPKPNESYTTCGTACPKTCENKDKNTICTRQCVEGCFCNDGYVKDANGVCILPESCPKTCPESEEYNECGTACPKTCKTKDALIKCTANCVAGCFCREGYIRDDINGKCIPLRDCPLVCGPNQVINKCPPCPKGLICTAVCTPRCECIPGYILDKTGTCIVKEPPPPPPTCGKNEVCDKCPPTSEAERSCVNVFKGTKPAHPIPCQPGCKCQPGYVRNGKSCVLEEKCCSDPNAELVKNPKCCGGGTIAKPDWVIGCGKISDPKGCQCKKGYLKKSDTDATCIAAVKECKKPLPVPLPVPGPVPCID